MAGSSIPAPPPLMGDDITHYRHIIAGGPGNTRQKITVEVADALTAARAAYAVALESWRESLR